MKETSRENYVKSAAPWKQTSQFPCFPALHVCSSSHDELRKRHCLTSSKAGKGRIGSFMGIRKRRRYRKRTRGHSPWEKTILKNLYNAFKNTE